MSLALCTHVQPLNTMCRWVEEEDQWELCAPALQGDWRSAAQRNWLDRAAAGIQVRTAWHATHSTVTNHSDTQQLCIQYRDMCTVTQCIHTTVTHVPHACTFNMRVYSIWHKCSKPLLPGCWTAWYAYNTWYWMDYMLLSLWNFCISRFWQLFLNKNCFNIFFNLLII